MEQFQKISPITLKDYQLFLDTKQKWNTWDVRRVKLYTITSISESPIEEGLIYVGTDDGNIQVTENGGKSWRKSTFKK